MSTHYWQQVRKDLKAIPIAEGIVAGDTPLYFERYIFSGVNKTVQGLFTSALVIQFGGARVKEGGRNNSLPGNVLLIPPRCDTHWQYSGFVDFGVFYFPDHTDGVLLRLRQLAEMKGTTMAFADTLVFSTGLALADELAKNSSMDDHFAELLAKVMMERAFRVLTTSKTANLSPGHTHFDRLKKTLDYVRENLATELTLEMLAGHAKVSVPHFQRIFNSAMGMSVHKFVLSARLEQARKLLVTTRMPLSHIAENCGFSSQSHLAKAFRSVHAATPTEFRKQMNRGAKS